MDQLSQEEINQAIGEIVNQFDLFECYQCMIAIMKWLKENQIRGKILELKTRYRDENYIISERHGNHQSITTNGKHYGVEINGKIFDNLSVQAMTREDWLKDFHCQSEEFLLSELEDFNE